MKKFNRDKAIKQLNRKRKWQKYSRYFYIGGPLAICLVLGIYFAYSKFMVSDVADVVKTTVGDFLYGDVILVPYIDGVYSSSFPKKDTGYVVNSVACNNDAAGIWDDSKWGVTVVNLTQRTKCSVYFTKTVTSEFNYTGGEQTFTASKSGTYRLEVWGAQGGSLNSYVGGTGGYSVSEITLNQGDKLYVNVGGMGGSNASITNVGGYNGGGASGNNSGAQSYGGGGATHIAKISGTIASIGSSNLDKILIIAAGGGGATAGSTTKGGNAGGYVGGAGSASDSTWNSDTYIPLGATQTGPGFAYGGSARQGSFGTGLTSNSTGWGGGGGGGLYGGSNGHGTTGSGGSSYVGNSLTFNKAMYCNGCSTSSVASTKTIAVTCSSGTATEKCAKTGNGYAKITYISANTVAKYDYTGAEETFIAPVKGTYKIEAWGAQGGSLNSYIGGYGGYSVGTVSLNANDKLYINVGGMGGSNSSITNSGGYNGGGYSGNNNGVQSYGGGGASSVAKASGTISKIGSSNLSQILIIAAGGGGATAGSSTQGGSGGGYIGGDGSASNSTFNSSTYIPIGASQTGPGYAYQNSTRKGSFGTGPTAITDGWGGGGGGGLYGGSNGHGTTGSGGSSYIGNSLLSNKTMYCYNCKTSSDTSTKTISNTCYNSNPVEKCSKLSNGYVKISLIG